jgi:hypothetical protein
MTTWQARVTTWQQIAVCDHESTPGVAVVRRRQASWSCVDVRRRGHVSTPRVAVNLDNAEPTIACEHCRRETSPNQPA